MIKFFIFLIIIYLSSCSIQKKNNFKTLATNEKYYEVTAKKKTPRDLLTDALKKIQDNIHTDNNKRPLAIDLGSGAGNETLYLLSQGWNVMAIDKNPEAIQILEHRVDLKYKDFLETQIEEFKNMQLPDNTQLVFASRSLYFTPPQEFEGVWKKITTSIAPGGYFVGEFIGDQDAFAKISTVHNQEDLERMFEEQFDIIKLKESKRTGNRINGDQVLRHEFTVIAKKNKK